MFQIKLWKGEKLNGPLALDIESNVVPFHTRNHRVITTQVYDGKNTVYFIEKKDLRSFILLHGHNKIIGQNIVFDMQVLSHEVGWAPIFRLYDRNLIYDTKLMYQLYKLATTGDIPYEGISLANLVQTFFGITLSKDMEIRGGFEQFANIPVMKIPKEFLEYAALDAYWTYKVWEALTDLTKPLDTLNTDLSLHIQVKGELVLDQLYKNGVGIDLPYAKALLTPLSKEVQDISTRLAMWGYVPGKSGVAQDYERIMETLGLVDSLPRSEKKGSLSAKEEDLRSLTYIPFVSDYLRYKDINTQIGHLEKLETTIIHPQYKNLLVTGRTSCSAKKDMGGINVQTMSKESGIRGCLVPKDKNNVFVDIDYSAIEMATLSQAIVDLYGKSSMGDMINSGLDLHVVMAGGIYEKNIGKGTKSDRGQITDKERQFAKIPNFGLGGGMGPTTFVKHAGKEGAQIDFEMAKKVIAVYKNTYKEMPQYFKEPSKHVDGYDEWGNEVYKHTSKTGRIRAHSPYSAWLNLHFQGLASDGLKLALYRLFKEGYHICMEVHDSILIECPKDKAEDVLKSASIIMIEEMKKLVPDIKVDVEGKIKERYS